MAKTLADVAALMLAALRRAEYQMAEEVDRRGDEDGEYDPPMAPALALVRDAIMKAEVFGVKEEASDGLE